MSEEWNKERIDKDRRYVDIVGTASNGLYLLCEISSALSEIERLQSEVSSLKELVGEMVTNCESLAEEYLPEHEGMHSSDCPLSTLGKYQQLEGDCNCGYSEKYLHNTELIEKAKEMIR